MKGLIIESLLIILLLGGGNLSVAIAGTEIADAQSKKLEIQRVTVAALCNEKSFVETDELEWSEIPDNLSGILAWYVKCKDIANPENNTLKKYFDQVKPLFGGDNISSADFKIYCDSLLSSLNNSNRKAGFIDRLSARFETIRSSDPPIVVAEEVSEAVENLTIGSDVVEEESDFSVAFVLSLVAIFIGILAIILLFVTKKNLKSELAVEVSKRRELKSKVEGLSSSIISLKSELKTQQSISATLTQEKDMTAERLEKLAKQQQTSESDSNKASSATAVTNQSVNPVPPPPPRMRYAVYADKGNGFSVLNLKEDSNSETIFEIFLTSDSTAEFGVSEGESAQAMAKTDIRMYLSDTCEYTNASTSSFIRTDQKGKLRLQGDVWLIEAKAKVSFV